MSSLEADPVVGSSDGPAPGPSKGELLEGAPVALGGPRGLEVFRTLPNKQRRMVGAWCFLDAYGPHDLTGSAGMRVGPHPHIGLQTVSWLVAGEILHRDSLGSRREIRPGQLNLMTAGRGISHSEETPVEHTPILQGVQLWAALPGADRDVAPAFDTHTELPKITERGLTATVLMGTLAGATSPARAYTPLVGAEITLAAGTDSHLRLQTDFEYAVLVLEGTATVAGTALRGGPLLFLGDGRRDLRLTCDTPARLLLLGGEPFEERLVMWWNYVARDHDEIVEARREWESGSAFGTVHGYEGPAIPAPPMPTTRLLSRGRIR